MSKYTSKNAKNAAFKLFTVYLSIYCYTSKIKDRITGQAKEQASHPLTHELTLYNPKNQMFHVKHMYFHQITDFFRFGNLFPRI